jgi:hypothetical protein
VSALGIYCYVFHRVIEIVLTEMEVVLHAISKKYESTDEVNDGWWIEYLLVTEFDIRTVLLTHGRWLLAKVSSLVASDKAPGLNFRCGSTRKLLVEANYTLHASSILCSTNGLFHISQSASI